MLKVVIDGVVFENVFQKGIQRYFFEITNRLANVNEITLSFEGSPAGSVPRASKTICVEAGDHLSRFSLVARARRRYRRSFRNGVIRQADVFHSSYYTLPIDSNVPQVLTVHDMIAERFCYTQGLDDAEVEKKRRAISAASVIIAISKATAGELKAFYPDVSNRIRIIYHGADHLGVSNEDQRAESQGGDSSVLFVGDRHLYKNFVLVLEAMLTSNWPREISLKVVGRPFAASEKLLIDRLGLSQRISHLGLIDDRQLATVYTTSLGFVFPSLAEGFGFPLLEAQSQCVPVVCSDIAVFREIAGNAAIFFDPTEPEDLASKISQLLDPAVRNVFVNEGRKNVARFSWDKCAAETMKCYEEAASARFI